MTGLPKVTVVIPVYNGEKYLGIAVDSILSQTFPDFELLVIDDGSIDRSIAVVLSYSDPRIRLECNPTNLGVSTTRNKGIQLARGEYLAFLDSDDWAYPERLAKQTAFLDNHPDCAAVGSWSEWMSEEGHPLGRIKRKPTSPDEIAAWRLFQQGIENSTSMARTVVLRRYRHREEFDVSEDFDLWARIAANHELATLPEVLVRRRMHANQLTQKKAARAQERRLVIYAAQLHLLGVSFTDTDLKHHLLLRSMRKRGFRPDLSYLEWAETWLLRLQAANQRAGCYPEPAFSQLLGRLWVKVCWHAARTDGWTVWWRFWCSALCRQTLSHIRLSSLWRSLTVTRKPHDFRNGARVWGRAKRTRAQDEDHSP
jgi:glycosyltransferase involved in cell wall biosynthesis